MANPENKFADNVAGPFYVDDSCIACGICETEAPENFKLSDDGDHAFVYKQPDNDEEREASIAAMESCPVDAIGDDGE